MGKARTRRIGRQGSSRGSMGKTQPSGLKSRDSQMATASGLLDLATQLWGRGEIEEAYGAAAKALKTLREIVKSSQTLSITEQVSASEDRTNLQQLDIIVLPAIKLLAELSVELGEIDEARLFFDEAVILDPHGVAPDSLGGGVDKFLWLAQLSEEGGQESLTWYQKGADILRKSIANLGETITPPHGREIKIADERKKLAAVLCSMIELYMTDLSWEIDAEANCERLLTEAMLIAPTSPETLQTMASMRISQGRIEAAKEALNQSVATWHNIDAIENPVECTNIPDFPTRISLARLFMEVEAEESALEVIERLVNEDDHSIEAWYLGGWCLYLIASRVSNGGEHSPTEMHDEVYSEGQESAKSSSEAYASSREWLKQSLTLYTLLSYEDERLRSHAEELVCLIDREIGAAEDRGNEAEDTGVEEDDEWEDLVNNDENMMAES